jgi:hypothetical protein
LGVNVSRQITEFLAPKQRLAGVDLCLPRLAGSRNAPLHLAGETQDTFAFPSLALAERDARSAMHVIRLIARASDWTSDLAFPTPEEFTQKLTEPRIGMVFGSRSNHALPWVEETAHLDDLIRFEFGKDWVIIGKDGRRFSLRDPSTLSREEYSASTDYGVVARTTNPRGGSLFLVAGLGGRATEGGGIYLFEKWSQLHSQFGNQDFAVVLQFDPPVDPNRCRAAASYVRRG